MIILEYIYKLITHLRNYLYSNNIIKSYKSSSYVISVGNIIAGGAGKTPIVIFLANKLTDLGFKVGIVSGGYKRKSRGFLVVHDGEKLLTNVEKTGDEAYLVAFNTGCITVVHNKKYLALQQIDKLFDVDIVIIDDGFQHRKISRDLDIVVINQRTITENKLIPAGILREEKNNLERADLLIYRDLDYLPKNFNNKIAYNFYTNILLEKHSPQSGIVVTSIANPSNFVNFLNANSVSIENVFTFKDHHYFKQKEINKLIDYCTGNNERTIFITEKDAVKLKKYQSNFEENGIELFIVEMTVNFVDESKFLEYLTNKVYDKNPKK